MRFTKAEWFQSPQRNPDPLLKQNSPAAVIIESWTRLSEQIFRVDKWSLCRD